MDGRDGHHLSTGILRRPYNTSKKKRKQCGMMTNSKSGLCYYHD